VLYGLMGLFILLSKGMEAKNKRFAPVGASGKAEETERMLAGLAAADPSVEPNRLKQRVSEVFLKLQSCWEARDYEPMRGLMTGHLHLVHSRKIADMIEAHEINIMENVELLEVKLVFACYKAEQAARSFTALITASARDYHIDDRTRSFLRGDSSAKRFQEYWVFELEKGAWVLSAINQLGESDSVSLENVCEVQALGAASAASATPALPAAGAYSPPSIAPLPAIPPLTPLGGAGAEAPLQPVAATACPAAALAPIGSLNSSAPAPAEEDPGFRRREPARGWSRRGAELTASAIFLCAYSAWEKGDPSALPSTDMFPALKKELEGMMTGCRKQGLAFSFEGLSLSRAEIVLVESAPPAPGEQFVARITGKARKTLLRNGKTVHAEAFATPFTEYWVFERDGGRWKAKELLPRANGKKVLQRDDEETDSSPTQMEWHYRQDGARG